MNDETYHDLMSEPPVFRESWLRDVLPCPETSPVLRVTARQAERSDTARVHFIDVFFGTEPGDGNKASLFLKTGRTGQSEDAYLELGIREAEFYRFSSRKPAGLQPTPRCLDSHVASDRSGYAILLEDLSDRYQAPDAALIADPRTWVSAAGRLADLHASYWNLDGLDGLLVRPDSPDAIEATLRETARQFGIFEEFARGLAPEGYLDACRKGLHLHADMVQDTRGRILSRRNVTLIHGDSHIHNFMFARQGSAPPVLLDYQFWSVGIAAGDLAHLSRVSFPEDSRKTLHRDLAVEYHKALVRNGVRDYPFDALWRDYRIQAAVMMLIPVWQFVGFRLPYEAWRDELPDLLANYRALMCDRL